MNLSQQLDAEISIADKLLQQLEDQYMAVVAQNIAQPKQNTEPQNDPENPYQPLEFDDEDDQEEIQNEQKDQHSNQEEKNKPQESSQNKVQSHQEQAEEQDLDAKAFRQQIQKMRIAKQHESNPQIKELIQVPPTDESIYTNLPHKQFVIDQDKIKSFALSMDIDEPEWLQDQTKCQARIQQLFTKKGNIPAKPFTKI